MKVETGLILVKDDIFTKIRKNLFNIFFYKESLLLKQIAELEKPRNTITGRIIIPKEIKKL